MDEQQQKDQLDPAELEDENGELLPDREAMSLLTLPGQPFVDPNPGAITNPVEPPAVE